ncbi:MAG: DEAD/DEAH box helicase family protein [Desulfobacteraceae bacterium]|jgi:superfamily II DNA or RNA helicase
MGKNVLDSNPVITILDSVHCHANKHARSIILPFLSYKSTFYKRGRWVQETSLKGKKNKKVRSSGGIEETTSPLITGRKGTAGHFYTGLLPRIKKQCRKNGIKIKFKGEQDKIKPKHKKPYLKDITFRKDQLRAIRKMAIKQRGRVIAPTGSGKTLIALGFMSMFPQLRILFLCHTKDLLTQTCEELDKFGFDYFQLGGGKKISWSSLDNYDSMILVSTIQSFSKAPRQYQMTYFDAVIVDEAHHAAKEDSQYGKLMSHNLAPIRIALTATEPTKEYEILVNEGLFGPTIAELTVEEGVEIGIIAKPKVNLICVPYSVETNKECGWKYTNCYQYGIVKNRKRNKLIVSDTITSIKAGEVVLIIVDKIEHGEILKSMLKSRKIYASFVRGSMDRFIRQNVKSKMKTEKKMVAICTKVWKEGINIPALRHIIYAAGLKEEKGIKQAMGRGLRTTENKNKIRLTDFMDPYKYLAEHSVLRFGIYQKLGWLK